MKRFEGKVALVTGGNRNTGRAIVRRFLSEGARVFFCGSSEASTREGVEALEAEGLSGFSAMKCDVSRKEDVAGLMLLGGAGVCMRDALRYQSRLLGQQTEEWKGIMGALLRKAASQEKVDANQDKLFDRCLSTEEDTIRFKGVRMSAKWVREHAAYTSEDYVDMIRSFGKPILAITGKADLSVDYRLLDSIKDVPSVTCYAPEGVNHIWREIDDDNSVLKVKKQYLRLSAKPMHEGTKGTMSVWLEQFRERA